VAVWDFLWAPSPVASSASVSAFYGSIKVFHTSDFEGYSGMLVFYTFMPIGIIIGALLGGVGLGLVGGRDGGERRPTGPS
jgi:hypothetical protein